MQSGIKSARLTDARRFVERLGFTPERGNHLRRQNPAVDGVQEAIEWVLYDSFSVAANTAFPKTVMFQTPVGQGGKTVAQTNMTAAGRLSSDERFAVRQVAIYVSNDTVPADAINISRNVSVVMQVRTKPYVQGIPIFYPPALGMYLTAAGQVGTAAAGNAALFATSNGGFDPGAGFTFAAPGITIGNQETFNVTLNPETAFSTQTAGNPVGVGTTIYALLFGTLLRGVQ